MNMKKILIEILRLLLRIIIFPGVLIFWGVTLGINLVSWIITGDYLVDEDNDLYEFSKINFWKKYFTINI